VLSVLSALIPPAIPIACARKPNLVWSVDEQVLQVAAGELLVRDDLDLALALLGDLDDVAEVTGAALDLDAVVQELLESLEIEDLVVDGLRAVDNELPQTSATHS
jgi:hypothetical protein